MYFPCSKIATTTQQLRVAETVAAAVPDALGGRSCGVVVSENVGNVWNSHECKITNIFRKGFIE